MWLPHNATHLSVATLPDRIFPPSPCNAIRISLRESVQPQPFFTSSQSHSSAFTISLHPLHSSSTVHTCIRFPSPGDLHTRDGIDDSPAAALSLRTESNWDTSHNRPRSEEHTSELQSRLHLV